MVGGLLLAGFGQADAVLIAYWNFNNLTAGSPPSNVNQTNYAVDQGAGTLNLVGFATWTSGTTYGINNFAGSLTNALGADIAGQALALQGGSSSTLQNNGASMVIQVNLTNVVDPVLSFATQKTSTGFNSNQVAWSLDGSTWTNFGSPYDPVTSYTFPNGLQSFDFSAINALDGVANAYFRVTFGGATGATGNNRIDNIQVNAVPEPATLAILGLAGAAVLRRRRNR